MTIARQFNISEFPFEVLNKAGDGIYWEDSDGYWSKREYDSNGNKLYFESSNGFWAKYEHDSKGNRIYYETSEGFY